MFSNSKFPQKLFQILERHPEIEKSSYITQYLCRVYQQIGPCVHDPMMEVFYYLGVNFLDIIVLQFNDKLNFKEGVPQILKIKD